MDKPEETTRAEFSAPAEPTTASTTDQQSPTRRQSWIEVLVDPRTLQGLMSCGGGLLVLGLVTWLWAIGVFENKMIVAAGLGVANFGLLALGVSGARYSRYQTGSKAITMLACLVMPLNLWFYDAQGLITLDQGGHLWVPALVCCALYVLVARALADPLFVNAIVGGVTMTGLLLLADHQVDRLWEVMAPSSFLVILGILCIHVERAFPPEEGPFSRKNFGRAFFNAGHVVMGLGLTVLFIGRVVGRLYERFFVHVDWLTLPEISTQANLKLIAIALVLGATYSYVYSQIIVQAKRRYVGLALLTTAWAATMVLDVLNVALTVELLMILTASTALVASLTSHFATRPEADEAEDSLLQTWAAPVWEVSKIWAIGLNFVTLALGLAIWWGIRFDLVDLVSSGQFSVMYVAAAIVGAVSCGLASRRRETAEVSTNSGWQLQAGTVLLWLAADALIAVLGFQLTTLVLIVEMLVALAVGIAANAASNESLRRTLATTAETLAILPLVLGIGGTLGRLFSGFDFASGQSGSVIFFALAAACLGLASRVSGRMLPAILAAVSICATTWHGFLLLGITRYVFVSAMTFIGLVCLVVGTILRQRDGTSDQFAIVSQWTGRVCISTASAATLLIALARLLTGETHWPLLGLVSAQAAAAGVAGLLSKEAAWRRHFWLLAGGQVLMTLIAYNTLIALSFWQRTEILVTCLGLVTLTLGYLGWSRETDKEDELVSFNLAIGSFLSAVPLTLGMLVQRFDNVLADWGWVLIHEAGVLSIGLLLLGAGVLCRIRWSTIVGGSTLLIYVVSLVGMIHLPEQLQTTAIYMMVGGGLFFGTAVLLSVYRDRLLAIPERMQNGEGVFRVLKWR